MKKKLNIIQIVDGKNTPKKLNPNAPTFFWKGNISKNFPNGISVNTLVEENELFFKNSFLDFLYRLGNHQLNGASLLEYFKIDRNINLWWLNLVNEKCNYSKSKWMNDAIKIHSLKKWVLNKKVKEIRLFSPNQALITSLKKLCKNEKIRINVKKTEKQNANTPKKVFLKLPKIFQGFLWLFYYLIKHWNLKNQGLDELKNNNSEITLISYLHDDDIKDGNKYYNPYWNKLIKLFKEKGKNINLLHIYLSNFNSSARTMKNYLDKLNDKKISNTYFTLDSFLSIKVVFKTLIQWTKLWNIGFQLRKINLNNYDEHYLESYIKEDLSESIFGKTGLETLLIFNLISCSLKSLKKQKLVLYLQENQIWESSLNQLWNKYNHGDLIGVPHSTIRFWDLRYFFSKNNFKSGNQKSYPRPNKIAINGYFFKKLMIQSGYPENEILDVEALRFDHIKIDQNKIMEKGNKSLKILVIGDYSPRQTKELIEIVNKCKDYLQKEVKFYFKFHPKGDSSLRRFFKYDFVELETFKMNDLKFYNIVLTSNSTTVALEAFLYGKKVISLLDSEILNFSPLKGVEEVSFISNYFDLIDQIKSFNNNINYSTNISKYFWMDQSLKKWEKLLKNYE